MLKRTLLVMLWLVPLSAAVPAADWELDVPHTSVQFRVSHLVIAKVVGGFGEFSANLSFDGKDVSSGSVDMTVSVASIDTDNEDRNKHLVSPDFFDAEEYPQMTFKSKRVIKGENNQFQLVGDLTIRGVTREVTFDCEYHGTAEFMGTTKTGFSANTKIDRQEFGVSWNRTLDAGGVVVGDQVEIMLELEFNQIG